MFLDDVRQSVQPVNVVCLGSSHTNGVPRLTLLQIRANTRLWFSTSEERHLFVLTGPTLAWNNSNNKNFVYSFKICVIIHNVKMINSLSAGTPAVVKSNRVCNPIYIILELIHGRKNASQEG